MNKAMQDPRETRAAATKPEWAMSKREKLNVERAAQGLPPKRRRWPWVVLVLVLAGGAGGYFFMTSQAPSGGGVVEKAEVAPVMQVNKMEYAVLAPQRLERLVKVTGTLSPSVSTQLSSQAGGKVEAVNARPGDAVSEGDVLVQVDTENLTLQLKQIRSTAEATRANLAQSESQLERTEELSRRGITSSSSLEQARSGVAALRANLKALESQVASSEISLKNATVRAPFDGIVAARSVEPGQIIGAGSPLMTIVDLDVMEMQGNAVISSGPLIAVGQSVKVAADGLQDRSFEGIVDRINPVATTGTRTIPVYIRIDNEGGPLRGGMFATGEIVVDAREDALAMPVEAIREDAEGDYVLRIKDGRLERAGIERGKTWNAGRMVDIVSGLQPGDTVVTALLPELKPGDSVELVGE